MSMVEDIRKKAQSKLMTIVLPEGDEPRTVQAAKIIKDEGYGRFYEYNKTLLNSY